MNDVLIWTLAWMMGGTPNVTNAQGDCQGWGVGRDSIDAIKHHVIYRDYMRSDEYEDAFKYWEYVYENAPSGSVRHFIDGAKIMKAFYEKETEETQKAAYGNKLLEVYDRRIQCFGKEGYVLGKKGMDMFYVLKSDYSETYQVFKKSIDLEGTNTNPNHIYPYAFIAVELFKQGKLDKEETMNVYQLVNDLTSAEHVEKAEEKDQANLLKARDNSNSKFDEVASKLFDCAYFVEKEQPNLEEAMKTSEGRIAMIKRLKKAKCDDTEPMLKNLIASEKGYRADVIESKKTPADHFYKAIRSGDFVAAKDHHTSSLEDPRISSSEKFKMTMMMSKHYYRDKKDKPTARRYAIQASKFNPNSGEPFLLIGDLYASSGSDCGKGTGWESQRVVWAAMDKWQKCIDVDPQSDFAAKAKKKIREYTKYMPTVEQIHTRSLKEGAPITIPCWIQEKTRIRAYNPFK